MYGKDEGEYSGFTPDNENAEKSRLQFFKPQIDWNSCIRPTKSVIDSNGNIMGYEAAKSHYVLYEDRSNGGGSSNFSNN
jgi:hypothetical protein